MAPTEAPRTAPAEPPVPGGTANPGFSFFGENRSEGDLGRRALRSGAAGMIARCLNGFIQVGSVFCLARLLTPEDYGLVGMVYALIAFMPVLVSLGTSDAVIQRKSISEAEVSALFWLSTATGLAAALILVSCGPLISRFYGEPRLTMIAAVLALPFIFSGLHCQHGALLRRAMRFEEAGMIDVASNLLSAIVAIVMAYYGFAYWALAARPVAQNLFVAIGVWWRCGWLPGRPKTTQGVKEMLKLGLNITGFTITDFLGKSADKVAIGHRSGAKLLGYYQNAAFVYDNVLDMLINCVHVVAVAGLSKVTGDLKEIRRLWRKALGTLVFYAMPIFGLLAMTSRDVIVLFLGAKWAVAGSLLSILALRGIPHAVERTAGWLHVAAGRTDRWMRWGALSTVVQLTALFFGLPFGPRGVVIGYVLGSTVLFIPAIAYAGRPLGIGARDVVQVTWRPLAGCMAAIGAGLLIRSTLLSSESPFLRTAALSSVYLAVYLLTAVGLLRMRSPVIVMVALVRELLPKRFAGVVTIPVDVE